MKNSNDNIGNRTRDLPGCSAVPPFFISRVLAITILHLTSLTAGLLHVTSLAIAILLTNLVIVLLHLPSLAIGLPHLTSFSIALLISASVNLTSGLFSLYISCVSLSDVLAPS